MNAPGAGVIAAPRVVLVEDDPSIRRFVALALEDLDVELVPCVDVGQALQVLAQAPAALVITDLMLPGESGMVLVERLAAQRSLCPTGRVAVFSAGLSEPVRAALQAYGVWRLLPKPVPVQALRDCVMQALAEGAGAGAASAFPAGLPHIQGDTGDVRARAIASHFGGDAQLHDDFLASCRIQFRADIDTGDQACARGDMPGLRLLLHSLKTVLDTLGHEASGALARRGEALAAAGESTPCAALWRELRTALDRLAR